MRVLFLISWIGPTSGWGTEYIQHLIFGLADQGINTTIINPIYKHTNPNWREWTKKLNKNPNIEIISINIPSLFKKNLMFHFLLTPILVTVTANQLIRKKHFDLIHDFSSTPIVLLRSAIFKFFFHIPTVFTLSVRNRSFLGSLLWFRIFNFAEYYLIPSQEIIKKLIQIGINRDKIIYTPPGFEVNRFTKLPDKYVAKKRLKLPQNRFIITFYGSLTKEKGVLDLISTADQLIKKNYHQIFFCFYAIWKGSGEHKFIKEKLELIDRNFIRISEGLVDIPTVLASSDLIVLPQQTGHGATIPIMSVLETVAAKKFIITTDIIGNREIVTVGNGILVSPKDPAQLANAIITTYHHPKSVKTNPKFVNQFDLEKVKSIYLSVYQKIKSSLLQ